MGRRRRTTDTQSGFISQRQPRPQSGMLGRVDAFAKSKIKPTFHPRDNFNRASGLFFCLRLINHESLGGTQTSSTLYSTSPFSTMQTHCRVLSFHAGKARFCGIIFSRNVYRSAAGPLKDIWGKIHVPSHCWTTLKVLLAVASLLEEANPGVTRNTNFRDRAQVEPKLLQDGINEQPHGFSSKV